MAFPSTPSLLISFSVAALVAWRIYSRIRRTIGRQRLSRVRAWITLTFFPALLALLLLTSLGHPLTALPLVAGGALGVGLGWYGLRLTRFEHTSLGVFYTPNAHLGIALSLLFLGRLAYRFARIYLVDPTTSPPSADFMRSPLTLLIFGTLAGYYIMYAIGLLRWHLTATAGADPVPAQNTHSPDAPPLAEQSTRPDA